MMQKVANRRIGPHCILACLYFLLLPTTIAVDSAGNSILKLATIPIGLFFVVTLLLSNRKLQINGVHLALLLYTLSTVATLFCDTGAVSVDFVFGYILNAALYICMTVIPYHKAELELMEKVQIILLVILNAITLFSNGTEDSRTTLVIMGQTSDPNYFVGFFIFPLTIALKQLVSGKHRVFYLVLIAASIYSAFLSGSRGGFIAVAVTFAGFAVLYPSGLAKRMVVLLGSMVLLFLLWIIFEPILPENIVERMSVESVLETGGTGRWDIWKSMLQEIVDQPEKLLLGRGINAMHRLFVHGKWMDAVAHNQVIQAVYNQGLIGLLSFLLLTGISFFRCIKRRKTVSIAILGMMALSLSLSFNQTTRTFWNLIAYAAFAFPDPDTNTINNGGFSDHEHYQYLQSCFSETVTPNQGQIDHTDAIYSSIKEQLEELMGSVRVLLSERNQTENEGIKVSNADMSAGIVGIGMSFAKRFVILSLAAYVLLCIPSLFTKKKTADAQEV